MAVPERDRSNECFTHAAEILGKANVDSADQANAIVLALEGIMRQIRDADDTQDSRLGELTATLNENAVLVADRITEAANAMNRLASATQELAESKKKGLF